MTKPMALLLAAALAAVHAVADGGATDAAPAASGSWTNVAGNAIEAVPLQIKGAKVTFRLPGGDKTKYPLSLFPESEQLRLRKALGEYVLPDDLATKRSYIKMQLEKYDAMERDGLITAETAEERRNTQRKIWKFTVNRSALSPEEKAHWIEL